MKSLITALFLMTAVIASAQEKVVQLTASLPSSHLLTGEQTAYVQLTLTGPRLGRVRRPPMNLCVVLDRSGSMGSERKIAYAREALNALVDQLRSDDRFALVIYDDVVEVAHESGPVEDRRGLRRLIASIEPRGSTNLGGGMTEGFRQVEHTFRRGMVNRVILLSDGLANQGITDPMELNRIARQFQARGISLTTMGVGLEYNENLMSGLAESGGGNYYFIEHPGTLASIVGKEFSRLSSLCAHGVRIELRPGRDVRIRDVIGYSWSMEGGRCVIDAGDVYAEERRTIVVELEIPSGNGPRRLADADIQYEPADGVVYKSSPAAVEVSFTPDRSLVLRHRNDDVQATVDVARSSRSVDRATRAMDAGNVVEARRELKVAAETAAASPVASGAGAATQQVIIQASRIKEFDRMLNDSSMDSRRAKKAIQFQNYQQQKSR